MNPERKMPIPDIEFRLAAENNENIPERLRLLHEVDGEFISRGVFFDVYAIELNNDKGEPEPYVFKDFRSGDTVMSLKEQIALFQH